jgi:hypothetical protein
MKSFVVGKRRTHVAREYTALVTELVRRVARIEGAEGDLAAASAVVVEGLVLPEDCARWTQGVLAAREHWTHDFGGEQYTLGRAFYTHFEEGKSAAYFADPAASDAAVETHAPGLQASMLDFVARAVGGRVRRRLGWCGPGVHVFPPGGPVASCGGVVHFDTEGLPARHAEQRLPAVTLVAILQAPEEGGGLRVWDVRYDGRDHPRDTELATPNAVVPYRPGQGILMDSYRLHQIQPFGGERERISATVHAAKLGEGLWEAWF